MESLDATKLHFSHNDYCSELNDPYPFLVSSVLLARVLILAHRA